uniref:thioredoxin-dependent peroxiredoxin n=1 Tax=Cacopsylla melanoneura TaxID=428564 RepID=A0A8D9EMC0_9HEMI
MSRRSVLFSLKVLALCWVNIALSNGEGSESCRSYENENVYPHTKPTTNTEHQLQWTKAMISKPAPFWQGTAVVDGQLKEIKLSDYFGKYLVFFFYPLDFTFVCPTELSRILELLLQTPVWSGEIIFKTSISGRSNVAQYLPQ